MILRYSLNDKKMPHPTTTYNMTHTPILLSLEVYKGEKRCISTNQDCGMVRYVHALGAAEAHLLLTDQ